MNSSICCTMYNSYMIFMIFLEKNRCVRSQTWVKLICIHGCKTEMIYTSKIYRFNACIVIFTCNLAKFFSSNRYQNLRWWFVFVMFFLEWTHSWSLRDQNRQIKWWTLFGTITKLIYAIWSSCWQAKYKVLLVYLFWLPKNDSIYVSWNSFE